MLDIKSWQLTWVGAKSCNTRISVTTVIVSLILAFQIKLGSLITMTWANVSDLFCSVSLYN